MEIRIPATEVEKIRKHGEESYPEECCGVLIGRTQGGLQILEARRMRNTSLDSRRTRYNIDPIDLLNLEDELDELGFEMIGIYHSHPDHPARPSTFDLDHAWPKLTYMVLSVDEGKANQLTSWRLMQDTKKFVEDIIIIEKA